MKQIERNIGRNRNAARLWLERACLIEAGFACGDRFNLEPAGSGFDIVKAEDGARKVSGKPARPVIDIAGKSLGEIGKAARVEITYAPGSGRMAVRDPATVYAFGRRFLEDKSAAELERIAAAGADAWSAETARQILAAH